MTNYQNGKQNTNLRRFFADIYCFDLFGKCAINFIKSDAIKPKTQKLVFFLLFYLILNL